MALSPLQEKSSSASSFHASLLQAISGVMSLAVLFDADANIATLFTSPYLRTSSCWVAFLCEAAPFLSSLQGMRVVITECALFVRNMVK